MNLYISNFKNFLIIFLITCIIGFFLTILLVEIHLRKEKYVDSGYLKDFINNKNEYLAFGDSRVESSIVSSNIVGNLGEPSDNINNIYDKIIYKINQNKKIKGVIIQADPHLFSFYRWYQFII